MRKKNDKVKLVLNTTDIFLELSRKEILTKTRNYVVRKLYGLGKGMVVLSLILGSSPGKYSSLFINPQCGDYPHRPTVSPARLAGKQAMQEFSASKLSMSANKTHIGQCPFQH